MIGGRFWLKFEKQAKNRLENKRLWQKKNVNNLGQKLVFFVLD